MAKHSLLGIQRRHAVATEHGQSLTHALLASMEKQIEPSIRPFPAILMRMLLGHHISDLLGIQRRYGLFPRVLFAGLHGLILASDGVMGFFQAKSWTTRFRVACVLARRFIKHLLIKNAFDTTEPLHLPDELLNGWKREPGRWRSNQQLEDYFVGDRADV